MRDSIHMPTPQSGRSIPSWSMLQSSPGPFMQGGDGLRLRATTTDATGTLTCAYRLLTKANQEIVTASFQMAFSGTGVQTAVSNPVAEGWIIGLWVGITSGTITDGEVQASVDIMQNVGATAFPVMSLCSGEVTNVRSLGLGAYDAIGYSATVPVGSLTQAVSADPIAGANVSIPVTAGQVWELIQLQVEFSADITVASRVVFLELVRSDGLYLDFYSTSPVTAEDDDWFIFTAGLNYSYAVGRWQPVTFPQGILLEGGSTIDVYAQAQQAGDDFGAAIYTYRRIA